MNCVLQSSYAIILDCSLLFYQLISLFTSLWCLTFALNVVLNLPTIIILDTAIMMITNISNRLLLCVELPTEFSMFVSLWGDLYSFVILPLISAWFELKIMLSHRSFPANEQDLEEKFIGASMKNWSLINIKPVTDCKTVGFFP